MSRLTLLVFLPLLWVCVGADNPYLYFDWKITWGTISPLGVPQQGILINGEFPGPNINATTNNNIVVNVFNNLDEPFLLSWTGIQHRKNSWQDGMPGTNCPIPPGQNHTYQFQVKDQIGSYFYFPSTGMHKAGGAFGGLRINTRPTVPIPIPGSEDDYTVLIGDWYTKGVKALQKQLDSGRSIGKPDGVLINGKNGKGDTKPMFTMEPGKVYRYRVCNVGTKTSLNFRVQDHNMNLIELEGSHTVQYTYESLDVHVGQCYSFLITADQAPRSYYMVASTRFTRYKFSATAIIGYSNSNAPPSSVLPEAPNGVTWSVNQFRSFRWNLTANAARPNPQGSYHYGKINITRTVKVVNSAGLVDGKLRYALNGLSYVEPATPLKLAEYYGVGEKVFKYNLLPDVPPSRSAIKLETHVLNATFRDYLEIVFENHEKSIQTYHLDGYSFFAVGMDHGKWNPDKRRVYNLLDAVSRYTVPVFPKSWTAILLTFDNAGMWNVRSQLWERFYLGQQFYISVLSPALSMKDEFNAPENHLQCGIIKGMTDPKPYIMNWV